MDQLTLPIVIGLDDTWDTKGSLGPVCFSQPGAGSEKSVCYIKLCFCQRGIQPNTTVIFWGTGRGIVDFDKQAYEDDVLLFWKNKAWANRRVFLEWENIHTHQISVDHHTEEYGSKEYLVILQDNLYDQVQKQYQDVCQEGDNNLCSYCHHEYTDNLDPPETGVGNQIMFLFGVYLDE